MGASPATPAGSLPPVPPLCTVSPRPGLSLGLHLLHSGASVPFIQLVDGSGELSGAVRRTIAPALNRTLGGQNRRFGLENPAAVGYAQDESSLLCKNICLLAFVRISECTTQSSTEHCEIHTKANKHIFSQSNELSS